ncbi:MAG: hypothetical protein H7A24_02355 [Leptospiraceae bacterium]|nr:hypothetical protein [Leptospiraceae bacterium]MCP5510692.1 hypothetical protein [Leptospiraceae bacterium]
MKNKSAEVQGRLFSPDRREVILRNLDNFSLPSHLESLIDQFLSGRRDESTLMCCHSECTVCNQTILDCVHQIQKELTVV